MLKIAGMLAVSLAVYLYCSLVADGIKEKMETEDAYIELLMHIKNLISAGNMPLNEIYSLFENKTLEKSGFCCILKSGDENALYMALKNKKSGASEAKLHTLMLSFSKSVGVCSSGTESVSLCEKYISLMQSCISACRENDLKKHTLYRKIGFILAVAVIVLCI